MGLGIGDSMRVESRTEDCADHSYCVATFTSSPVFLTWRRFAA
jgi:hypothetical protein